MTNKTNKTEIVELADRMKWPVMARYEQYVSRDVSFEENLLHLLRAAADENERAVLKRRLKAASFPVLKTIDDFDFAKAKLPFFNKEEYLSLFSCDFINEHTNVVAIGNCGTGKTHLMTALAFEALRKGFSVRFCRVSDLLMQLREARSEKRLNTMLKALFRVKLLVLDELGYISMDKDNTDLLFQLIANRYEVSSTIVTSNLDFQKWPEMLGDPLLASALIDRLIHRSTVLNMNGDGYRLKDGR